MRKMATDLTKPRQSFYQRHRAQLIRWLDTHTMLIQKQRRRPWSPEKRKEELEK